jgi:hypothetical protein
MGDIWPYGPPAFVTWQACYDEANTWFGSSSIAATFAAIAAAESKLDYRVINDTPASGDYSVGLWQINYIGSLYASRTAAYGTPQQLIQGGLTRQFYAAMGIYHGQGFRAWSTYNSGAYLAYLHGYTPAGGGNTGGQPTLQEGSSGQAVVTLQNDLDQLGYNLSQDGQFGPLTRAAVVSFQRNHGLVPDGIVGPLTWAAINAALPAQLPSGSPVPGTPPPSEPPGNIDGDTLNAWSSLGANVAREAATLLTSAASASNTLKGI